MGNQTESSMRKLQIIQNKIICIIDFNFIKDYVEMISRYGTFLLLPHHLLLLVIFNTFFLVFSLFHPGAERGIWVNFTKKIAYGDFLKRFQKSWAFIH